MRPLALVTMVYDDDVFLDIYLRHWDRFVPREHIFVLMHGNYERYEAMARGCNTLRIHRGAMHPDSERDRWRMLGHFASGLATQFGKVMYTDVDEIVVLDPAVGPDPADYILNHSAPVVAPHGVDLVHLPDAEPGDYDPARAVLDQRRHVSANGYYSKPAITSVPIRWSSGGHFCDREDYALDRNLTLFHLRLFDRAIFEARSRQRLAMVTDPETGQPIPSLGGVTWRQTAFPIASYRTDDVRQVNRLFRARIARRSRELRKIHDGIYIRTPVVRRELDRIPARYEGLF